MQEAVAVGTHYVVAESTAEAKHYIERIKNLELMFAGKIEDYETLNTKHQEDLETLETNLSAQIIKFSNGIMMESKKTFDDLKQEQAQLMNTMQAITAEAPKDGVPKSEAPKSRELSPKSEVSPKSEAPKEEAPKEECPKRVLPVLFLRAV